MHLHRLWLLPVLLLLRPREDGLVLLLRMLERLPEHLVLVLPLLLLLLGLGEHLSMLDALLHDMLLVAVLLLWTRLLTWLRSSRWLPEMRRGRDSLLSWLLLLLPLLLLRNDSALSLVMELVQEPGDVDPLGIDIWGSLLGQWVLYRRRLPLD